MRVTGVVCLTVFSTALGCAGAASAEPVPAPSRARVVASAVGAEQSWTQLQADRRARSATARPDSDTFSVAGPRAALLERVRSQVPRVGPAPTASATTAIDGPITVQQGSAVRSFDPVTGAASAQRFAAGSSLPAWGPAGDRLMTQMGGSSPEVVLTDEDGASNLVNLGSDKSVTRPRWQAAWSPFGDSANVATNATAGGSYQVNPYARGWYFHTGGHIPEQSPVVNSYGDLIVTKWSEATSDPAAPRRHGLTVTRGSYPDGRQPSGPTVDVSTAPYTDFGSPAIGLAPDGSVAELSSDYLALPIRLPAGSGGAGLFVDHADGAGLTRVASIGAVCPGSQVAFSPSHGRIAYLEAAGPAGKECSRTRLWVMEADGERYGTTAPRLVADSGTGGPFESMSWKAQTPAPFAGRISGPDRVATGVAASRVLFAPGTARVAVLAGSDAYADALVATPLAGRMGGPLLLTRSTSLDGRVAGELTRAMLPGATVYLVGGPSAVGEAVADAVEARGFSVVRLAGRDRFETAVRIARELDQKDPRPETYPHSPVLVADGTGFADALVAGPAASHWFGTVVLSDGARLPASTKAYLKDAMAASPESSERWMNAVGAAAVQAVASDALTAGKFDSAYGRDRYETAEAVARTFFWAPSVAGVADGRNWPDAATGGVAMAHLGMPLMLVNGSTTPTPTQNWWRLTRSATDAVVAFGSAAVVTDAPVNRAQELGGRQTALWGPDLL